jgi:AraC family transcriptional activator of pobA
VLEDLVLSFSAVTREARTLQRGSDAAIAAHVELIMLHVWRFVGSPAPVRQTVSGRSQIFERFSELVDQHFPEHWSVSKFAETLGVTEDHLHTICTREAGRGPLAIVHARLIETARVRLETSVVPIEQIAGRLGFTDAGYFNRFFKKRVGVSPGAYRRRMIAQRLSERGEALAAWP